MLLQMLPILVFAVIVAGTIQNLLSPAIIARWIGTESGLRGVLVGTALGACTPGGPYISMPIAAGVLRMGANVGTMVAFMSAWALIGIQRLPIEIGIMGWRFAVIRLACTFFFAPVSGLIANALFSRVRII